MQRMSDMFARWLEESFRAGQRHRARTSTSRSTSVSSSSSSVASSPTYLSSSSSESSSASGVFEEEPRRRQIAEPRSETLFSRDGLMLRSTVDHSSVELDADPPVIQDISNRGQRTYANSRNISSTTSLELIPHSEEGQENPSQTIASASAASDSCSSNGTITLEGDFASSGQQSPQSLTPTSMSVDEARCSRSAPELSSPKRDRPVQLVASSSSVSNQNRPQKRTKNAKKAESVGNVTGVSYNAEELSGGDMYSFSMATPEASHVTRTRAQPTPCQETCSSRNTQEIFEVDSSDHERSSAATRIQRVYRLHKKAKISAQSDEQHVWIPEMTRVYKGHRNARTMVSVKHKQVMKH